MIEIVQSDVALAASVVIGLAATAAAILRDTARRVRGSSGGAPAAA